MSNELLPLVKLSRWFVPMVLAAAPAVSSASVAGIWIHHPYALPYSVQVQPTSTAFFDHIQWEGAESRFAGGPAYDGRIEPIHHQDSFSVKFKADPGFSFTDIALGFGEYSYWNWWQFYLKVFVPDASYSGPNGDPIDFGYTDRTTSQLHVENGIDEGTPGVIVEYLGANWWGGGGTNFPFQLLLPGGAIHVNAPLFTVNMKLLDTVAYGTMSYSDFRPRVVGITAVPEPSSALMLAVGVAGVLGWGCRRVRRSGQ